MSDERLEWIISVAETGLEVNRKELKELVSNGKLSYDKSGGLPPKYEKTMQHPSGMSDLELICIFEKETGKKASNDREANEKGLLDYLWEKSRETCSEVMSRFLDRGTNSPLIFFRTKGDDEKVMLSMHQEKLPKTSKIEQSCAVYFAKTKGIQVPPVGGKKDEINLAMSKAIEYGVLPGHALVMLRRMIVGVFSSGESKFGGRISGRISSVLEDPNAVVHASIPEEEISSSKASQHELNANMNKFAAQLGNAIQQVDGDIHLPIPKLAVKLNENNINAAAQNPEVVEQLTMTLDKWKNLLQSVVNNLQDTLKTNQVSKRQARRGAEHQRKSVIQGHLPLEGPTAEINFWRNRNALLSAIWEQLRHPAVRNIIKTLEIANGEGIQEFSIHLKELLVHYTEAKDNVKFLTTLERYFKNIESGNLSTMIENIPSMMNALRMVWIISRHYNTDDRMVPLMDLIAVEISEKVAQKINVRNIFQKRPEQAMKIINQGKRVLELWFSSYQKQRELIFNSGTDHRWEFDRKLLFEQTNYMARICSHLYYVAETLGQFMKFLGPQLKEVTKDIKEIDELSAKVDGLKKPLENLPFNIFDRRYNASWEQMMKTFESKVDEIEERSTELIDTSFRQLRTAEGAFNLLQDFRNIECRKKIQEQMMKKFSDILDRFGEEITEVNNIFQKHKHKPPISKDQPTIAGSIAWSRSLYARIKHVVIRFQEAHGLYESPEFQGVKEHYLKVAMEIVSFEENLFASWCEKAEEIVEPKLKAAILKRWDEKLDRPLQTFIDVNAGKQVTLLGCIRVHSTKTKIKAQLLKSQDMRAWIEGEGMDAELHITPILDEYLWGITQASIVLGKNAQTSTNMEELKVTWNNKLVELIRECIFEWMISNNETDVKLTPPSGRLARAIEYSLEDWFAIRDVIGARVNYSFDLCEISRETKYLDRMGFDVPESATRVFLQEFKYYDYVERLRWMLEQYRAVLRGLTHPEKCAVRRCFQHLFSSLRPGFTHLNWNSLGIGTFFDESIKAIQQFSGVVARLKQSILQIDKKISLIAESHLVSLTNFSREHTQVMRVDDMCRIVDDYRESTAQKMAREYEAIIPLMLKIESVVAQSETNCQAVLKELYTDVEFKIYVALLKAICNGMVNLQKIMVLHEDIPRKGALGRLFGDKSVQKPLIGVQLVMNSPPEITVVPRITDISKSISALLKNIVASAYQFPRWQKGSTILCEKIKVGNSSDEMKLYTFHDDVKEDSINIKAELAKVNDRVQIIFAQVANLVSDWSYYDNKFGLWDSRTFSNIERLRGQKKTAVYFNNKITPYYKLYEQMATIPIYQTVGFIRVDLSSLIAEVRKKAKEWVQRYCSILHEEASIILMGVWKQMDEFEKLLKAESLETINDLQKVLSTIREIQRLNMQMLLDFHVIDDSYDCLMKFKDNVSQDEIRKRKNLLPRWKALVFASKKRDIELLRTKEKFAKKCMEMVATFDNGAADVKSDFVANGPDFPKISLDDGLSLMKLYEEKMADIGQERGRLVNAQKLFNIPVTTYPELAWIEKQMAKLKKLFDVYSYHRKKEEDWAAVFWTDLDIKVLDEGCETSLAKLASLKDLSDLVTYKKLEECIVGFKNSIPLFESLKNDALRPRHWKTLMEVTGIEFEMNPNTFTLGKIFEMQLHKFAPEIQKITNGAIQERKIEKKLNEIKSGWSKKNFPMSKYEVMFILADTSEIEADLEDDVLNLQTLLNSRFIGVFREQVNTWDKNLNLIGDCIKLWLTVQQKWMYLEGIFMKSEDIRTQLQQAAKAFDAVHDEFHKVQDGLNTNPNVLKACQTPKRLEQLKRLSGALDMCQKSLSDYLESKRNAFPRFFYISDDELLSILGTSDPTNVQEHMMKLYVNCKSLIFKGDAVCGMISSEGEQFNFKESVAAEGKVEVWMNEVQDAMKSTLHLLCKEAVYIYPKLDRIKWIEENLGMIGIVGTQIWWTWEVIDVFRRVATGDKHAMKTFNLKLTGQINELVAKMRDVSITKKTRSKINTLIVLDVHSRDIISSFVRDSILDASEFEWESQLRFYWSREKDDIEILQCTGSFLYGYEYEGLNGRLVITPLTDRCVMTLTTALTFCMGGSPAGPAGTGKTETVKDLAKALAIPCFVTNCGEGLDYKAIGAIFSGLVQVGAWGCFDEFNRINLEVLSVVSTLLRTILRAVMRRAETFELLGHDLKCDIRVGFFVTMNPGYAGRTELPDSLKSMFRPVTMIVPDLLQICEIMLFAEGFTEARVLAKKMTVLYKLSEEQLSKQYHYDFGLRALKSVLIMAGALKRGSDYGEDMTLMRALRDMNAPKFVYEDVPLFLQLIEDLFPGLDCPRVQHQGLKNAIVNDMEKNGFRHSDESVFSVQVDKIVQLYETMITRHTCMVVGPTMGGKTVVIETLANAEKIAFKVPVKISRMNPKAQTVSELYGQMDPVTRDWTDGILSKIFRTLNENIRGKKEVRWLLFDGDVDALWVENMNSVMDDNRLLTLPNGERIRLEDHVKLLVEVFDLQYASPATVSRCGMVYVDPKDLMWKPYYEKWVNEFSNSDDERNSLMELSLKYIDISVEFIFEGLINGEQIKEGKCSTIIPMNVLAVVKQLCNIYSSVFAMTSLGEENLNFDPRADQEIRESIYVFAIIWSLGGPLLAKDRIRFDEYVKETSGRTLASLAGKNKLPKVSLFDFYFDIKKETWILWEKLVIDYVPPDPFVFSKIVVPTVDTVRNTFFLDHFLQYKQSILFVGDSGTAKTLTINNYLGLLNNETYSTLTVNFSSRTTSLDVQRNLMDVIEKRGPVWTPAGGKKLYVFVDDLNMPKVDIYGTQQPIALLKFLIDKGSMYERDGDLELINARNLFWVAAMAPPGGGRNPVDPRFVSLLNVVNVVFPSKEALHRIYSSILTQHVRHFNQEVQAAAEGLTAVMMNFYWQLVTVLPPTPSKFHYIFNLRDLSRVYEGLCLSTLDIYDTPTKFIRLWRNECLRIFHDRVISAEDKEIVMDRLLGSIIKTEYPALYEDVCKNPSIFGDYRQVNETENAQLYEDLGDYGNIKTIFDAVLAKYNSKKKEMALVLFEDALEHLTRIHRILKLPRGNMLLIGVGGSGKQSLTRLASFAAGYDVFEITLARNYGEMEFREDLKSLYSILGSENKKITFLFTDAHVVDEGFLELINNMLASGIVPALFDEEEKLPLVDSVRDAVEAAGINPNKDNCWSYFVNRCRDNLHITLAMSPAGETLRTRCRNFPAMVANTVIDWFYPWPAEALQKVASVLLKDIELPKKKRPNIIDHIVEVHLSMPKFSERFEMEMRRKNHVTPKNYLDYLSNYETQLAKFRDENTQKIEKLSGGLNQLIKTADNVNELREELSEQNVVVNEKSDECTLMIKEIKLRSAEAAQKKDDATKKKAKLQVDSLEIKEQKRLAEMALEEALPALQMAKDALKNLKKEDIAEIKVLAHPKESVKNVCLCVLNLKPGGADNDPSEGWDGARKMMGDAAFLQKLQNYPKDDITERMYNAVRKIRKKPPKDRSQVLTMETLMRVSKAGAGLLQWVISMMTYRDVAKEVAPRRKRVKDMEKAMIKAQKDLIKTEADLEALEAQIQELSETYASKSVELTELQTKAEVMTRSLESAAKLIEGLGSERLRWTADKEELIKRQDRLIGDCLLASSFLSYTGAFNFDFRKETVYEMWQQDMVIREIPLTQPFKVENLLTTPVEISQWVAEGLPADELSVQNGILTTRASRWPLCIDPQMQAIKWIKERENDNKLNIRTFNDGDFVKILELSLQFGNPFLFENVDEEIDPIINNILEKNFVYNNQQKQIVLGDNMLDYDESFRLYLVSKLSNPAYTPEVAGRTMIINYSVTKGGLADQLLDVVVGHERPDLQQQREDLIQTMSKNNIMLADLESVLLKELTEATGNILENKVLISTLQNAKAKSVFIAEQQVESSETAEELEKVASQYRPVANRGSILFFSISGLSVISRMYEFSLAAYLGYFRQSLETAKRNPVVATRLNNIVDTLTKMVYNYVCTGIFEKHKLMYSFQMASMILDGRKELVREELDFFLKGNIRLEDVKEAKPTEWISAAGWKDVEGLVKMSGDDGVFSNLQTDLKANLGEWKRWYDLERPEETKSPLKLKKDVVLTPLQDLLILRCIRPDRVYNGVRNFVVHVMQDNYYVQPPVLEYSKIFAKSTNVQPIVFIQTPGADPMGELEKLAVQMNMVDSNKFKFLALGQGQGPLATALLEVGSTRGHWVVLQNCHLMPSWLRILEKLLESGIKKKSHPDFRLWLTSEATPKFPIGLLQNSYKVVTEPPDGLKLNIKTSYSRVKEETLADCEHLAFRPLVYVLSFFHAVVQERRKFGKLGWNVHYDFNECDYDVSLRLLSLYLTKAFNNKSKMPWGSLRYLIGEAMYGGRVTDDFDRRVLITYLNEYMGDFIFDDFQPFFFSRSSFDYQVPEWGPLANYTNMISTLPLDYSPEVFGLHSNAEIGYYTNATKTLWKSLIDMQPRAAVAGSGILREDYIMQVSKDIKAKVPQPFDLPMIKKRLTDDAFPKPLSPNNVVLVQELERWNIMVAKIRETLNDLQKALVGEIGMSDELDNMSNSLYTGFLPAPWARLAPATEKPLASWMNHFQKRYRQYMEWTTNRKDPVVMWLSGLHIPETYIAALVQTTCRKKNWPLDKSTLYTKVTKIKNARQVKEEMDYGCYIHGLYLEGAGWNYDEACLTRQEPKKLIYELPVMKIIPIEASKLKLQNTFKTPVYVTQSRRNAMGVGLVFEADLTTDKHDSHWVLQGTALCLNISS